MRTADRYAYDEKNYIREVSLLDLCREIVRKWLIILIAAGLLINNRIGVIMEYPEKLAEQNAANKAEQMIEEAQDAQDSQDDQKSDKDSKKSE